MALLPVLRVSGMLLGQRYLPPPPLSPGSLPTHRITPVTCSIGKHREERRRVYTQGEEGEHSVQSLLFFLESESTLHRVVSPLLRT